MGFYGAGYLNEDLAEALSRMVKWRNIFVHEAVDPERLYEILNQLDDLRRFAGQIQRLSSEGTEHDRHLSLMCGGRSPSTVVEPLTDPRHATVKGLSSANILP
ncbi:MAG TPA: HepT-like ribonuclease domain-containing protein [Blastocatellia bacterium]|nr:HepT-like ribonuclease domain-containing protein [Blastocatellia bacterium]